MAASPSSSSPAADRDVVITRMLAAPRRVVFQAWTEPLRVAQWWGPAGFTAHDVQMDVRPGGEWRIGMRGPDGTEHWARGIYREIVVPERLVLTWAWEAPADPRGRETLLTVVLVERHGHTELTLRHGIFTEEEQAASHYEGWSECLDRLRDFVSAIR